MFPGPAFPVPEMDGRMVGRFERMKPLELGNGEADADAVPLALALAEALALALALPVALAVTLAVLLAGLLVATPKFGRKEGEYVSVPL